MILLWFNPASGSTLCSHSLTSPPPYFPTGIWERIRKKQKQKQKQTNKQKTDEELRLPIRFVIKMKTSL